MLYGATIHERVKELGWTSVRRPRRLSVSSSGSSKIPCNESRC